MCEAFIIKNGFIKYKQRKLWIYSCDLKVNLYLSFVQIEWILHICASQRLNP